MGIAVDPGGNALVANYGGRRVVRVSSAGEVRSVVEQSGPWSPTGVALSGGDVYVLEAGTAPGSTDSVRVRRLHSGGTVTTLAVINHGRPDVGEDGRR
jgi:sugar lactone lactonase YvrE